jgi:hypothetical protein
VREPATAGRAHTETQLSKVASGSYRYSPSNSVPDSTTLPGHTAPELGAPVGAAVGEADGDGVSSTACARRDCGCTAVVSASDNNCSSASSCSPSVHSALTPCPIVNGHSKGQQNLYGFAFAACCKV